AVLRQEIDLLRADELGGEHEIALVLAVLVVDQDDDLAGADRADDLDDRADGGGLPAHGSIIGQRGITPLRGRGNSDSRRRASAYAGRLTCAPPGLGTRGGESAGLRRTPMGRRVQTAKKRAALV